LDPLAYGLARQLSERYCINKIRFKERSIRGKEDAYTRFYRKIGASPVPEELAWDWDFDVDQVSLKLT